MDGNPGDERFIPLDSAVEGEKLNVQATNIEGTEGSSSSSANLREEAIQVATVEAEMDELRRQLETSRNTNVMREKQTSSGRVESQAMEVMRSQAMAAKSSSHPGSSGSNRQRSGTEELSHTTDSHTQQLGRDKDDRNIESQREGELVESRHEGYMGKSQMNIQEQGNMEGQHLGNRHNSNSQLNKEPVSYQQTTSPNTRNPSLQDEVHPSQRVTMNTPRTQVDEIQFSKNKEAGGYSRGLTPIP